MRDTSNTMLTLVLRAASVALWFAPLAMGKTYTMPNQTNYSCTLPDDVYYCTPAEYSYTGTPPFVIKFYTSAMRMETPEVIDSRNYTTWLTTLGSGAGTKLWIDCAWPTVDYHIAVDAPLIIQQNTSACDWGSTEPSGGVEPAPETTEHSEDSSGSGSSLSTEAIAAIAAGTAGGVIAVAALLGCLWFMKRKKRPTVTTIGRLDLSESTSTVNLPTPTAAITPFSYELVPSESTATTPLGGALTAEPTSMSQTSSPRTSMYAKPSRPTHNRMRTLSADTSLSGTTSMGRTSFTLGSMGTTTGSMGNASTNRKSATSLGQVAQADPQFPEATDPDREVRMHHDAGRVESRDAAMPPAEIPPAYDASWRADDRE